MTKDSFQISLAYTLAKLKETISNALEDFDTVPKHSAAVVDRVTEYRADDQRVG